MNFVKRIKYYKNEAYKSLKLYYELNVFKRLLYVIALLAYSQ